MSWKFHSFLILIGAAIVSVQCDKKTSDETQDTREVEGNGKSSEDRIIGGEEVKKGEE